MRDKDLINLEEAYQTIQENKFKSLAAAAALGVGNLAHAQMTPDDYINKTHDVSPSSQEEGETAWHKAKVAYDRATDQGGRNVDQETLKAITGDQDTAERYGLYLLQHGLQIPHIIKMASPKYTKRLGDFSDSNTRN